MKYVVTLNGKTMRLRSKRLTPLSPLLPTPLPQLPLLQPHPLPPQQLPLLPPLPQ